jgi:hypothetical protein
MTSGRGSGWLGFVAIAIAGTGVAAAQPRPAAPALVGATEVLRVTSPAGFIDDAVAADATRVAYVVSDAASKAELHVVTLATRAEQVIDLAPVTLHPIALELVGPRLFVVGRLEDGRQLGALVELADKGRGRPAGTPVYKIAPAAHVTRLPRGVAVHRVAPAAAGGETHTVELIAIDSGRRVGAARALALDAARASKPLDFRVNHWSEGWTRAHGIKGGEWDRKENQRTPDREAAYDVLAGRFTEQAPIADLFEQRRRFQTLAAEAEGRSDFFRMDPAGIQLWRAGKPRVVELDQPLASYDPRSLQGVAGPDGSAWIAIKVDPVNPDAVARKKADPEYLDVFQAPAGGKAVRKARVLAQGVRHRFGVAGDRFWLIERNQGFDRGGKSLALYRLP